MVTVSAVLFLPPPAPPAGIAGFGARVAVVKVRDSLFFIFHIIILRKCLCFGIIRKTKLGLFSATHEHVMIKQLV